MDVNSGTFKSYAFFASILLFKLFFMSLFTAYYRITRKIFMNAEDAVDKQARVGTDPDIDRIKRGHANDLENIVPFLVLGLLYCTTSPDQWTANFLFKLFTVARVAHTLVYTVFVVRQPARVLAWAVGFGIQVYMTWKVFMHYM